MKQEEKVYNETNLEEAFSWYPEMKNQYIPLGWKNCIFEFMLMWNGDIITPTKVLLKKGLENYHHTDAQFGFYWMVGEDIRSYELVTDKRNDNLPFKRWYKDDWKPVAIINRFLKGIEIIETVFSHVPGGTELRSGDEPMYLWVDFEIKKVIDVLVPENEINLFTEITAQRLKTSMTAGSNSYNEDPPRSYSYEMSMYENYLMQDDGKVRLMVENNSNLDIYFHKVLERGKGAHIRLDNVMDIKIIFENGRANIRLLIPIIPVESAKIEAEMSVGYHKAMKETLDFWERIMQKGAKVTVPEKFIENVIRSNPWRMLTMAERNPEYGEYLLNCGSYSYDSTWATPGSITNVWGLDYMGYHEDAARYIEVFRKNQGKDDPPGKYFIPHTGFLSTPERYVTIKWLNEHGAIMWCAGEHYLLTRDDDFLGKWLPCLLKACEWIYEQRRCIAHPGTIGIMPPAVASDDRLYGQFIWNDGWIYKGLATVVKVLKEIKHVDVVKWEKEVMEYKDRFNEIFMDLLNKVPFWIDNEGQKVSFIPTEINGGIWENNRAAFYLDTGVLFLAFAGLIDHQSPVFDAALKWFREGPQVKYWRFDGCCWQVPILYHEMSSCEPTYSWNMDINFLRNDIKRYIEGLYAQFAGARTKDLFSEIETRNGQFAVNFTTPVAIRHFRNCLIYENGKNLELMKIIPKAWLKPRDILKFENVPTYFGPMGLIVETDVCGRSIQVDINLPTRNEPEAIYLNIPECMKEGDVFINGAKIEFQGNRLEIRKKRGKQNIKVVYKSR